MRLPHITSPGRARSHESSAQPHEQTDTAKNEPAASLFAEGHTLRSHPPGIFRGCGLMVSALPLLV